jgi:hypothetical protein
VREKIKTGIESVRKLLRFYYADAYYRYVLNEERCDIVTEDWDNLVILDACRFDAFESTNTIDDDLEYRYSKGSATPEFLRRNFQGKELDDIVYVTANPFVDLTLDDEFHDVLSVWKTDWDDDLKTVHPCSVTECAETARTEYPNKRLIIHYNQPHEPMIGEVGRETIDIQVGNEHVRANAIGRDGGVEGNSAFSRLQKGIVSKDDLWDAYIENLELVLEYVETLLPELPGKTVVTADHGNLFGERAVPYPTKAYGHPGYFHAINVVKIPWLVVMNGPRPTIVGEASESNLEGEHEEIEERLAHLGYKM